jgi:hypothetical protein
MGMPDMREFFRRGMEPDAEAINPEEEESSAEVTMSSVVTIQEDGRTTTLSNRNGDKKLKVSEDDGKVLFEGPVNTDKQVDALPKDIRALYDKVNKRASVEIKTRRGPTLKKSGSLDV